MRFTFAPMATPYAQQIVAWRYDPPYDLYNVSTGDPTVEIRWLIDPANAYFALLDEQNDLIGFRCFGADAQVPGGDYSANALDTGGGLCPDLTGRGLGRSVLEAGLAFGQQVFDPPGWRVTVAAFNERALRMCRSAGFQPIQHFARRSDRRVFVMLVRHAQGGTHDDQA